MQNIVAGRLEHLKYLASDPLVARLCGLRRLTSDIDGTVIRTGGQVAWAFRGFNPHQRKDPSYYPLLAHLAQAGQGLAPQNRPGNVHDSCEALRFLRYSAVTMNTRLSPSSTSASRMRWRRELFSDYG